MKKYLPDTASRSHPEGLGNTLAPFQNTRFALAQVQTEIELSRALLEKYTAKNDLCGNV